MAVYYATVPPTGPTAGDQWINSTAAKFGDIQVFDGAVWRESDIAAAAGSLTGTTLAANVVNSSLTSVGILGSPHMTGAVVDSGGLVITAGGLQVTAGNMAFGGAPVTNALIGINAATLITASGGAAYGIGLGPSLTLKAAATSDILRALSIAPTWNANGNASLTSYGIDIGAVNTANGTNAAINIAASTGATNNYGVIVAVPTGGTINDSIALVGGNVAYHSALGTRKWSLGIDGSNNIELFDVAGAGAVNMTWTHSGGVQIAAPTGGDKGVGTLNVSGNVYLNGTAYTNPHGGFEAAYTGKVERFADRMKAMGMPNWTHMSMDAMEAYTREHMHFPGFADEDERGLFDGGERVLLMLEWLAAHTFILAKRIQHLEGVA